MTNDMLPIAAGPLTQRMLPRKLGQGRMIGWKISGFSESFRLRRRKYGDMRLPLRLPNAFPHPKRCGQAIWSTLQRTWSSMHSRILCLIESFHILDVLIPVATRRCLAHLLLLSAWMGSLYLTWYFSWRTPLPVYILDRMNLRPFFLPNIMCDHCSNFTYQTVVANKDFCKDQDVFLLILVATFHANMNARQAIRKTWGSVKEYRGMKIKTLFIFGWHGDKNLNSQVLYELEHYGDVMQKNFTEDYRTLTNKTVMALEWVRDYCPSAKYILKTDDDAFNVPQRYVDYLLSVTQKKFVGGYCFTVMPDRRESSKFFVPESMFPDKYYPTYCSGPGYVISQSALRDIVSVSPNVTFLPMEDVFVSGLCRVAAGIQYTQISGTAMDQSFMTECNLATWVKNGHNIVPERALELWPRVANKSREQSCAGRNTGILLCFFFFMVIWCKHLWNLANKAADRTA